jgi:hypothetical protein
MYIVQFNTAIENIKEIQELYSVTSCGFAETPGDVHFTLTVPDEHLMEDMPRFLKWAKTYSDDKEIVERKKGGLHIYWNAKDYSTWLSKKEMQKILEIYPV